MANEQLVGIKELMPLYSHLGWLLEQEALKSMAVNDIDLTKQIDQRTQQFNNLEDWFVILRRLYSRVAGIFTDKDCKIVTDIVDKILAITGGDNFSYNVKRQLTPEDFIKIREHCEDLSLAINRLLIKYKVHIDVQSHAVYESHADEVDEENSQ